MKILVYVKQVPDMDHMTVIEDPRGGAVVGEFNTLRMNRGDEFAVEAALQLKGSLLGVQVDALTVGPASALAVLRRAVGMGADKAVHLLTAGGQETGPAAVAQQISRYARHRHYALILFGTLSEDGMHGQVGPMTAALMDFPCATQVIGMRVGDDGGSVLVQREVAAGMRERLWLMLPAVISVQPGINRPRYPSLSNLLRANKQVVETITVYGCESGGDAVTCVGLRFPPRRRASKLLEGSTQEKAQRFVSILAAKAFIP
jgi:electron transfer flavoprotein beta subunit